MRRRKNNIMNESFDRETVAWVELIGTVLNGFDGKRIVEVGQHGDAGLIRCISALYNPKELIGFNPAFPSRKITDFARVEQICAEKNTLPDNSVDGIYSDCAFEHVENLQELLGSMHRILKPGGILFSHFGPLWSTSFGHHLASHDEHGRFFNYHTVRLPPWCHLLMKQEQVETILLQRFSPETAKRWADFVFNSPEQNKLFFSDYAEIFFASDFEILLFKGYDCPEMREKYPSEYMFLPILKEKFPNKTGFFYDGIRVVLRKRDDPIR